MWVNAAVLVAATTIWNGATVVQWTLSTSLQLTLSMRQSFISVCAQLSSYSDIPTTKNLNMCGIYENNTELLNYVCSLKRKHIEFKKTWKVIKRAHHIPDGNNPFCRLCTKEATAVVYVLKDKNCLNKKSECRHIKQSLLRLNKF